MTTKAERISILVGSVKVDAYLMPDGSYKLAGRNITECINENPKSLSQKLNVKTLKALPGADASLSQGVRSTTGETFIPVSLSDAVRYWSIMNRAGNSTAGDLIDSLAVEALDRRLDKAFNIQRTEEEYNNRLMARMASKKDFNEMTKAIHDTGIRFTSHDYAKFVHRFQHGIGIVDGTRDQLASADLVRLTAGQLAIASLVKCGIDPWVALDKYLDSTGAI